MASQPIRKGRDESSSLVILRKLNNLINVTMARGDTYIPHNPRTQVEVFNLETMDWETTGHDPFPFGKLGYTTNIAIGKTFISVGGAESWDINWQRFSYRVSKIIYYMMYFNK